MSCLTAFEAAARYQNFRQASEELHVTREAISRQVRLLEKFVGGELFVRHHTGVKLTPTGLTLFTSITPLLQGLSETFSDISVSENLSECRLKITTTIKFATLWLSRRIIDFNEKYPHINVEVVVNDQILDLSENNIDLAIRYGAGQWDNADVIATLIDCVHYFLICSPSFLKKLPSPAGVDDIAKSRLLYLTGDPHEWENWDAWFNAFGGRDIQKSNIIAFDNYTSILQAVIGGHGVALGWDVVVNDLLKDGTVVCPVEEKVKSVNGYSLVQPPSKPTSQVMQLFIDWVTQEVRETKKGQ
ncbi:LysR substrate-binding domain-containing protein [Kiloniella sp.]|uniref:LysR substrate-binding domain-containing protein n=1 Tax=Kiloniella sp. TaxID=1938587 RepID=UPI003B01172D